MLASVLKKCLLISVATILLIPTGKAETKDQHSKVVLRTIAHEFLLQLNDSTSRILPIEKVDGRYVVQFENEFSFEPDLLSLAALKILEANKIRESYIVEVKKCGGKEVAYSFETSLKLDNNLIPCKQRPLPKDCYVFYFTVIENVASAQPSESTKNDGLSYMYAIILIGITIGVIVYLKKRNRNSKSSPSLINIGQYQFDQKGMSLLLKTQAVELSSKEADLLFLLFSNENKTLERDYILNVVWGDNGDYVGRTLDVFISKLRKKLEADPSIKIINIRGVGYRFVIN